MQSDFQHSEPGAEFQGAFDKLARAGFEPSSNGMRAARCIVNIMPEGDGFAAYVSILTASGRRMLVIDQIDAEAANFINW